MEYNKNTIIAGLLALVLLWAGNILYFKEQQLTRPLFMKHYYDLPFYDEYNLNLYYLVNNDDKRRIGGITFPELSENYAFAVEEADSNIYKYHRLKRVTIRLNNTDLRYLTKARQLVIKELLIMYSNGDVQKINVGRIHISLVAPNQKFVDMHTAGSGGNDDSGGFGFDEFSVLKPTKITEIKHSFEDILADKLLVNINEQPLKETSLPFELNNGKRMRVSYAFRFNKDHKLWSSYYQIGINLKGEIKGQQAQETFFANHQPYFSEEQVRQMVKEGRDD
ncbi:MAG: hypothetical protein M0Z31_12460 [Clostridia bacterium]|nr:hypothetical protein [Clostridia bacterium]